MELINNAKLTVFKKGAYWVESEAKFALLFMGVFVKCMYMYVVVRVRE